MGAALCCKKQQVTLNGRKAENELLATFLRECQGDKLQNKEDQQQQGEWEVVANDDDNEDVMVDGKKKISEKQRCKVMKKKHQDVPGLTTYRGVGLISADYMDVFHYFENQLGHDVFELIEEIDDRRDMYYWLETLNEEIKQTPSKSSNNLKERGESREEVSITIGDSQNNNDEVSLTIDPAAMPRKKTATRGRSMKRSLVDLPESGYRNRDFVFYRSTFKVGTNRICMIAESLDNKRQHRKPPPETVRGKVNLMGVLVEELSDSERAEFHNLAELEKNVAIDPEKYILGKRAAKEPMTRVTFILSINPRFTTEEILKVQENLVSKLFGADRVRTVVNGTVAFFDSEENKMYQRFRQSAQAPIGTMGWVEQEKSKNDMQLGTNIRHPKLGHGIVRKFDMKGKIHVAYDDGTIVEHDPSEKEDLRVAVQIGTRVFHPSRGTGTVKQFDETGRVHVKFDNGEYHRYKQAAWKKKMHQYKMLGKLGALETTTISYRDIEESREKQGRVQFAVGATTREVLEYLLDYKEDEKAGNVMKNEIIEDISYFHRIRYQHRKMPAPLSDRDFVFDEIWREIAPLTYLVITNSVQHPSKPDIPAIVRGKLVSSGYLVEPIFSDDGKDHIAQITHMLCMDPCGFVPPDAVSGIRTAMLLGAVTDIRAAFYRRTEQKKAGSTFNKKRISKRMSGTQSGRVLIGLNSNAFSENRLSIRKAPGL